MGQTDRRTDGRTAALLNSTTLVAGTKTISILIIHLLQINQSNPFNVHNSFVFSEIAQMKSEYIWQITVPFVCTCLDTKHCHNSHVLPFV